MIDLDGSWYYIVGSIYTWVLGAVDWMQKQKKEKKTRDTHTPIDRYEETDEKSRDNNNARVKHARTPTTQDTTERI